MSPRFVDVAPRNGFSQPLELMTVWDPSTVNAPDPSSNFDWGWDAVAVDAKDKAAHDIIT